MPNQLVLQEYYEKNDHLQTVINIVNDLLQDARENKKLFKLTRELVEFKVRPFKQPGTSSKLELTISSNPDFISREIEKLISWVKQHFPNTDILFEAKLFPYDVQHLIVGAVFTKHNRLLLAGTNSISRKTNRLFSLLSSNVRELAVLEDRFLVAAVRTKLKEAGVLIRKSPTKSDAIMMEEDFLESMPKTTAVRSNTMKAQTAPAVVETTRAELTGVISQETGSEAEAVDQNKQAWEAEERGGELIAKATKEEVLKVEAAEGGELNIDILPKEMAGDEKQPVILDQGEELGVEVIAEDKLPEDVVVEEEELKDLDGDMGPEDVVEENTSGDEEVGAAEVEDMNDTATGKKINGTNGGNGIESAVFEEFGKALESDESPESPVRQVTESIAPQSDRMMRFSDVYEAIRLPQESLRAKDELYMSILLDRPFSFLIDKMGMRWSGKVVRLKSVLTVNNATTPKKFLILLGVLDPTENQWNRLIRQLNSKVRFNRRIGFSSEKYLLEWLRNYHFLPKKFRTEPTIDSSQLLTEENVDVQLGQIQPIIQPKVEKETEKEIEIQISENLRDRVLKSDQIAKQKIMEKAPEDQEFSFMSARTIYRSQVRVNKLCRLLIANQITTPREILKLLPNKNPTLREWEEMINSLRDKSPYLSVGRASSGFLLEWMRHKKFLPLDFRVY